LKKPGKREGGTLMSLGGSIEQGRGGRERGPEKRGKKGRGECLTSKAEEGLGE